MLTIPSQRWDGDFPHAADTWSAASGVQMGQVGSCPDWLRSTPTTCNGVGGEAPQQHATDPRGGETGHGAPVVRHDGFCHRGDKNPSYQYVNLSTLKGRMIIF